MSSRFCCAAHTYLYSELGLGRRGEGLGDCLVVAVVSFVFPQPTMHVWKIFEYAPNDPETDACSIMRRTVWS